MLASRHRFNANVTAKILVRDTFISLIREVLHILKTRQIFLAVSPHVCASRDLLTTQIIFHRLARVYLI